MLDSSGPYHLGERFSALDMHMAMWAVYGIDDTDDVADRFPSVSKVTREVLERSRSGPVLAQLRTDMSRWRERTDHMHTETGEY